MNRPSHAASAKATRHLIHASRKRNGPSGLAQRLARIVVVFGIVTLAAAVLPGVARAERVTATLEFVDSDGQRSPIRRATVEIHRKYGSFISVWHHDFTVTTDEQGHFDITVPTVGPGAVYGLRVYAINDAAIVRYENRPADAFYVQPGPGSGTQYVSRGPSDVFDFSWNFTDAVARRHFNIADALIYGRDYALARRATGEPEPVNPVNVFVESGNTFYDPAAGSLRLNPTYGMDDFTILHEYAHALQHKLSSFQWLATWHDGCNVQLGQGSAHSEGPVIGWEEGFASYFPQAVARVYGSDISGPQLGTLPDLPGTPSIETPSCPGGPSPHPPDWLENFIAGALFDLIDDSGAAEPGDVLCGPANANTIFSIFDRELQRQPPTLQAFVDAWIARGLDLPALQSTFRVHGVTITRPPTRRYFSPYVAADPTVWRPSDGRWYIHGFSGPHWGLPGDVPVPADYDGDGVTDVAVWRPSTGEWWVLLSHSGGVHQVTQWGLPTDVPLPGDYDGDGETDYAVYRPSEKALLVHNDSCGSWRRISLAAWDGTPVVGDVDGDGRDDPGVYNAATGDMTMLTNAFRPTYSYAKTTRVAANATPVLADYDGDNKADPATYTPAVRKFWGRIYGGFWTIAKSTLGGAVRTETWGALGDVPAQADFDGNGSADLAVWNPWTGIWTIRRADGSANTLQWGTTGDIPVPR